MKFTTTAFLALASTALAAPQQTKRTACTAPGTYICAADRTTMEVCDFDGYYKRLSPGCPTGTSCSYPANGGGLPYCTNNPVPPPPVTPRDGESCGKVNEFTCFVNAQGKAGIRICDQQYKLQTVGLCPKRCDYIGGIPFCLD